MSQIMIKDARWQTLSFSLSLSHFLSVSLVSSYLFAAFSTPCTVSAALFLAIILHSYPLFFPSSQKAPSLLTPYFSHFLLVPHGVAFYSSFCPQLWQNLITHWFTSGCGEVNRGDKEGKDRSNEEGRWKGCSRESEGQMWADKRERIGSRWKLSTNLKECSEKRRLLASCA